MTEALDYVGAMSPATLEPYPTNLVCEALSVARSSVYAHAGGGGQGGAPPTAKRGPKTAVSDADLLAAICGTIEGSPFTGEGHKKVTRRLRRSGVRVGKNRVLRLMRANGLLAPVRRGHERGDPAHAGTIIEAEPDRMWGTDATKFWTLDDGWCWTFIALDHCTEEVMGHYEAKKGDRWAALEVIRQGVRRRWGAFGSGIARGLRLRHDWGTQFTSKDYQAEIAFLGIENSPSFVAEPETNGIAERFMRTLPRRCSTGRGSGTSPMPARRSRRSSNGTTGSGSSSDTATGHRRRCVPPSLPPGSKPLDPPRLPPRRNEVPSPFSGFRTRRGCVQGIGGYTGAISDMAIKIPVASAAFSHRASRPL